MDVLEIRILKGPNYWSNYWQKLIAVTLDIKQYEELPTNALDGFSQRLKNLLPTMYQHHCSRGIAGGFFQRLDEGTWLGHVVEHIALELQNLAGMDCGFGRTRSTKTKGIYHVVFSYEIERAGLYALNAAIKIVENLATQQDYFNLEQDIKILKEILTEECLGISTKAILREAQKLNIPFQQLDKRSLVRLGQGVNQKLISATLTSSTPCLSADIVSDKNLTKELLAAAFIPVPRGRVISDIAELDDAIAELNFPLVIKPLNGNHGRGITTYIMNRDKAVTAFQRAQKISPQCIIEHYVQGNDYRFLVINYKLVAVAKRIPALVIGDGVSTITQLVDIINQQPLRSYGHENILSKIHMDEVTLEILAENNLNPDSVLEKDSILYLKHAANISSGGTAIDVTNKTHPKNAFLAERIARLLHLDICGIDIIAEKISTEITENNGAIIEVNAAPGLRMHLSPSEGQGINVARHVIAMLFPEPSKSRIPLIAVTGTNGKTSTVRLIANFASQAGYTVGYTTTDGIYVDNNLVYSGDCSGPQSAQTVLGDPLVNFAVLECARGGIIRSGLGFDHCDISILMNISEDHLGIDGIHSLEELARVKSVVVRSTRKDGYAVLNADDDLVFAMKNDLRCHIALFSRDAVNPRIIEHCNNGGLAAYIENQQLVINNANNKIRLANLQDISITCGATAHCMVQNILAAVLVGSICNFSHNNLVLWLKKITSAQLPGRMNLFTLGEVRVLVDYAHNSGAFLELQQFLKRIKCGKKIGIIGTPGDRRAQDIRNIGFYSAQLFNQIIIRHDIDGRGRSNEEITKLLVEGINQAQTDCQFHVTSDEHSALLKALAESKASDFIVYCPEDVFKAINFLKDLENSLKFHPETL